MMLNANAFKAKCDQMELAIDVLVQESFEYYQRAKKQGDTTLVSKGNAQNTNLTQERVIYHS